MRHVGYLVWNKMNPGYRKFAEQSLTAADAKAGYVQSKVYTDDKLESPAP